MICSAFRPGGVLQALRTRVAEHGYGLAAAWKLLSADDIAAGLGQA